MTDTNPAPVVSNMIAQTQSRLRSQLVPWMHCWFIEEFGMLRTNVSLMGELIEGRRRQYDSEFRDAIATMSPEDAALYAEFRLEDTAFIDMLPQLQWRSQYLMIYAAFEHALNRICAVARQRLGVPKDQGPSKLSTLERINACLKECSIDVDLAAAGWQRIGVHGKLRNKLTHANGVFSAPDFEKTLIATLPGLQLRVEDQEITVLLGAETLLDAINVMHRFLTLLANYEHPALA